MGSTKPFTGQSPQINGNRATFIWLGKNTPSLTGDFNDWEEEKALRLENVKRDVWSLTLEFAAGAYIEYEFILDGKHVNDPNNPRTVSSGLNATNQYFYMPPGAPTPLAWRKRGIAKGVVTSHVVDCMDLCMGQKRKVYLYQPPVTGPYPLIVVFDGQDYLRRARLTAIMDNLISLGRIQPVALAMVANGGRARSLEYLCNEATLGFLVKVILPLAQQELELVDIQSNPGAYGIMGASLGGLMALYAGLRLPTLFGKILSQSGAFWPELVIYDLVNCGSVKPVKIWMDVGLYEGLCEENQKMYAALASRGYDVTYNEYPAGHNYSAWRDDVWRGLEHLFGL
jgi:enterochelin esterase-like enzyme